MATAIATSDPINNHKPVLVPTVVLTVALSIASVFQECLAKVPLEKIQKRGVENSFDFRFNLCSNATSHPCFDPLSNLDLNNKEACTKFLLEVGQELTMLIQPSNFEYNIEVDHIEVIGTDPAIKSTYISIQCFSKRSQYDQPLVLESICGKIVPSEALYKIYKENSHKTWLMPSSNQVNFL